MSNFLGRPDPSSLPVQYRPAKPDEIHPALRLILGADGYLAENEQVFEFVSYAQQRGINLGDLWIAERGGQMAWAVLPILSPGRTALLLMPTTRHKDEALASLVDAMSSRLAQRGIHLAQMLLDPTDTHGQRLFASHGFRRMAELIYLHGVIRRGTAYPPLPEGFAWRTYSPQMHELFATTIAATYDESLDCPGLNGLRDIEDVLSGHKSSGEFDPKYWYVLTEGNVGRGVLLMTRLPKTDTAELVYLGLAPHARRRGLGEVLMLQALAVTSEMNLSRLSLAVDSGNAPALKLYYRFGLSRAGSKVAMMRVLSR